MKVPSFSAFLVGLIAVVSACSASCSDDFGNVPNPPHLVVTLDPASDPGSLDAPLLLAINVPLTFHVTVQAFTPDGAVDTTFNRYVRMSSKPGAIDPLEGADTEGRNVLLTNGSSVGFDVKVTNAYGITYIVADDLGYTPADPLRDPPPACSNGQDDDGDDEIDFPSDEGCAFANDDDEKGGTFSQGVSAPIYFTLPRIAQARGLKCIGGTCSGNGETPYPRQQLIIDTGYRDDGSYKFDTVVTRISSSGFYITDLLNDTNPPDTNGFNSVFAFNFNAPPLMRTCDRMKAFAGTASEFFGFTQMSYPTWTLEAWDPAKRPCLVPEPERLTPTVIAEPTELLKRSANFVRLETAPDGSQHVKVTPKFGPGNVPKDPSGNYVPNADASNCDFDKNGKITFAPGDPENDCNTACTHDAECTEWSNYLGRGTFRLTVTDSNGIAAAIQADGSAASGFDPVALKGQELRYFAGTMSFFSGGSQYTVEARCNDDVIVSLEDRPFVTDKECTTDDQCSVDAGLPAGFTCVGLSDGAKACRQLDPAAASIKNPPPLACVFPRTFLDENPQ
jgi:hypothetical protein